MSTKKILSTLSLILAANTSFADLNCTSANDSSVVCQANTVIQAHAQDVEQEILNSPLAAGNDPKLLQNLSTLFQNAYGMSILTAATFTGTPGQPSTYSTTLLTGAWDCLGPPNNAYPQNPPGTMPNMWIRDGAAQLHSYLGIYQDKTHTYPISEINALSDLIIGFINNAATTLNTNLNQHPPTTDNNTYEMDTMAYFIWLSYDFWQASGQTAQFNQNYYNALTEVISTVHLYQRKDINGNALPYTGMSYSQNRASDDATLLPFNVPDNMFMAVAMADAQTILTKNYANDPANYPDVNQWITNAQQLQTQITTGIEQYGTLNRPPYGKIYAYETDGAGTDTFTTQSNISSYFLSFKPFSASLGAVFFDPNNSIEVSLTNPKTNVTTYLTPFTDYTTSQASNSLILTHAPPAGQTLTVRGNFIMMDDANPPSLLSAPYFGFVNDPSTMANTRAVILSQTNPYYFNDSGNAPVLSGIGSQHTYNLVNNGIWPLALIAQGITQQNPSNQVSLLNLLYTSSTFTPSNLGCDAPGKDTPQQQQQYPATGYLHESFSTDQSDTNYLRGSRGWFIWPNAFFAEWIDQMALAATQGNPKTAFPWSIAS